MGGSSFSGFSWGRTSSSPLGVCTWEGAPFRGFRGGGLWWGDALALELLADLLGGALEAVSK